MGEVARALGFGSSIEWKGKTYTLSAWNEGIKAKLELFFQGRAWKAAERAAQHLSPSAAKEALAAVSRDAAAGVYDFGSEVISKGLSELPGLQYLTYLLMAESDPSVTQQLVSEIVAHDLEGIAQKINESTADPTKPAETPPGIKLAA